MMRSLHEYLGSLHWEDDEAPPIVPLGLFFEGNDEEESIAPNQWGYGRPSIASLYNRFKEVATRSDVSDVYVGLHQEWCDPEYADTFPPAETVFIVTSADKSQVESWLTDLETDGVLQGWPHGKPKNAPAPSKGHQVYWISWD
jgi:hypothetical protein